MSPVLSISAKRHYGLARVCRVWGFARAGIYRWREAANLPTPPRSRPGPSGPMPDAALVAGIRAALAASPFHGEGYRKVWARLRHTGVRTSKERVRRLMRENALSADTGRAAPRGPRVHDGTIIPETIDTMWGTDMTATVTVQHVQVALLVCGGSSHAVRVIYVALPYSFHEAVIEHAMLTRQIGGSGQFRLLARGYLTARGCTLTLFAIAVERIPETDLCATEFSQASSA